VVEITKIISIILVGFVMDPPLNAGEAGLVQLGGPHLQHGAEALHLLLQGAHLQIILYTYGHFSSNIQGNKESVATYYSYRDKK
jgi:hypothetical protein